MANTHGACQYLVCKELVCLDTMLGNCTYCDQLNTHYRKATVLGNAYKCRPLAPIV